MPVRELSERTRVPRLGKIRLGEKTASSGGSERPVARPYFVLPPELKGLFEENPTEIKIVFLSDDEETILSQYYRLYNASHGLVCKGDGYKADALLDADEVEKRDGDISAPLPRNVWAHGSTRGRKATSRVMRQSIECLGRGYNGNPACEMYGAEGCGEKLFMQAAVIGAPGLGIYQIDTGSVISIQNINGAIRFVKLLTGGRVAGIPFVMKRVKAEVQRPPDMKKTVVWTVTMEVDPALNPGRLLDQAAKAPVYALLPPPDESEDGIDDEQAEDDYHQRRPALPAAVVDYSWSIVDGKCTRCGKKHPPDWKHDGDCSKCRQRPAVEKEMYCEECKAAFDARLAEERHEQPEEPQIFTRGQKPAAAPANDDARECKRLLSEISETTDNKWFTDYRGKLREKYSTAFDDRGAFTPERCSDLEGLLVDLQVAAGMPPTEAEKSVAPAQPGAML